MIRSITSLRTGIFADRVLRKSTNEAPTNESESPTLASVEIQSGFVGKEVIYGGCTRVPLANGEIAKWRALACETTFLNGFLKT
jgi:hypothetical protein